ncbi:sugar phosphate isomerase/epimerase family protein [Mariniblastus fucicola]|uniref:Xylose isomerase-like TIM barrel n=1 Tax=Mariniblastus fucicola TaxID=980251 RepID=A0A5B9PB29_9BACT|nr:sugar phosphate isomerase/epimerase family protein [Mariniblastus fucicola]QEG21726.1 Xylose isomerase-like TIM barrel [Mariniblastus fucicola]
MTNPLNRRDFLAATSAAAALTLAAPATSTFAAINKPADEPPFKISLAQWSLNRELRGGKMDNLEFAKTAKDLGINAIEYVNQFFKDKAEDTAYLDQMIKRCDDNGVKSLLIMVDGEGQLGNPDDAARKKAVENHYKWVTAAKHMGCHSIRVNAASGGTYQEQAERAADGLRSLSEFAAQHDINVIVENHGGLSSNGQWLAQVIRKVDLDNCGTLPDFGNFWIEWPRNGKKGNYYDRYIGMAALMPFAKAVSAKAYKFDAEGNEVDIDFRKIMQIVYDAGYRGYVGIEFEGQGEAKEGITKTRQLLEKCRDELAG